MKNTSAFAKRLHAKEVDYVPPELAWSKNYPIYPGWYWCCAPGVWPQAIEFTYSKGQIVPNDRHTNAHKDGRFWKIFAGPIQEPTTPLEFICKDKRNLSANPDWRMPSCRLN